MNIFQKISYSPTTTKIAYGVCAGCILIAIGLGVGVGIKIANNVQKSHELETQLASLTAQYNEKQLAFQTNNNGKANVVQANLNSAQQAGYTVALYQTNMSADKTISEADMVAIRTLLRDKTYPWLDLKNVTYTCITSAGFGDSSFVVVWSAEQDGKLLAYITATYFVETNDFADISVNRTINYDDIINGTHYSEPTQETDQTETAGDTQPTETAGETGQDAQTTDPNFDVTPDTTASEETSNG